MNGRASSIALSSEQRALVDEVRRLAENPGGIPKLLPMLADRSWAVRREVVSALAALGEPAVAPLAELLRSARDDEARIAATVDALSTSSAEVFDELAKLSESEQPAVVADIAQVLGRRRNQRYCELLARLVGHADDNVAVAAIEALGRIGGTGGLDALVAAAGSGNFFRMFPAIDVLGRSGDPRVVAPLAALLGEAMYTLEAARALGRTGEPAAVPPLAALLSRPSESAVRVAALALAELHARHAERYGDSNAIEDALRLANLRDGVDRRLAASLNSADSAEQCALSFVLGAFGSDVAKAALLSLLDANENVAHAAARALKQSGLDSERVLSDALLSGGSARRRALLPALTGAANVAAVAQCLRDDDPEVRVLACNALASMGAPVVAADLFELLDDPHPRVVQAAIGAIQALGSRETKQLALASAESTRPSVRLSAMRILSYFGYPEALPVFVRAVDSDDARVRDAALAGLALLDAGEAVDALLAAARAPLNKKRAAAVRALGQSESQDARIAACLLEGLRDPDAWVRYYACQAIGRRRLEGAIDAVIPLLSDEAGHVRVVTVEALSLFRSPSALSALLGAANGTDPDGRRAALIGLGMLQLPEVLPVLTEAATSADTATRLVALSSLGDSRLPEAVPTLAAAALDGDESVRIAAQELLSSFSSREAAEALIEVARRGLDRTRVTALLSSSNEAIVATISRTLDDANEEVALLLTSALARGRSAAASAALVRAMSTGSTASRKASATALSSLRTPEAFQALRRAADADPDPEVRNICAVLVAQ
jgi:HEAT repeat protein